MAIDFLGTDEYLNCGSSASLDNLSAKTITAWINTDGIPSGSVDPIVTKSNSDTWAFFTCGVGAPYNSSSLVFFQGYALANGVWCSPENSISSGVWIHVAVTVPSRTTGEAAAFFINGSSVAVTQVQAANGAAQDDSAKSLGVGTEIGEGSPRYFDGRMEDVRVFNRVLTAQEIANLAGGYRGPLGGEALWLPMQETDGATLSSAAAVVFDMSGNGNHGTPQGGCLGAASIAPRMSGWIPQ